MTFAYFVEPLAQHQRERVEEAFQGDPQLQVLLQLAASAVSHYRALDANKAEQIPKLSATRDELQAIAAQSSALAQSLRQLNVDARTALKYHIHSGRMQGIKYPLDLAALADHLESFAKIAGDGRRFYAERAGKGGRPADVAALDVVEMLANGFPGPLSGEGSRFRELICIVLEICGSGVDVAKYIERVLRGRAQRNGHLINQ